MTLFIDVDPNAPHDEDCGFWHGFACQCKPEMKKALYMSHCTECDFQHGSGYNRCNCGGYCLYPSDAEHECELGVPRFVRTRSGRVHEYHCLTLTHDGPCMCPMVLAIYEPKRHTTEIK